MYEKEDRYCIWPTKPELFVVWPLEAKVCLPLKQSKEHASGSRRPRICVEAM